MAVIERFPKRRILYSTLVPPLAFAPLGILLLFLGIEVSIIRDTWYLSIFVSCVVLAIRYRTPLSQIGLSKRNLGLSLFLAAVWESVTFLVLGVLPFFAITGRLPVLVHFDWSMMPSMFHFMLVGLAEETWMRGLLLKTLRDWKPKGLSPVVLSSLFFVLIHVPAATPILIQDLSALPLLMLSLFSLFVWSVGLAIIVLKTDNLFGPIITHGLDDFVSKVLYPLQI